MKTDKAEQSKLTQKHWLWGFWQLHADSGEYEFRPESELGTPNTESLVLASCHYGTRAIDRFEADRLTVLDSLASVKGGTADITVTEQDMAAIEAMPDLFDACQFFLVSLESHKRGGLSFDPTYADWATVEWKIRNAVKKAKGI